MKDDTLDRYLDGELSEEERSQLNLWLEQDPAHVQRLTERASLHAELRRRLQRTAIEDDVLPATRSKNPQRVEADILLNRRTPGRLPGVLRYGIVSLIAVVLTLIIDHGLTRRPEGPSSSAGVPFVYESVDSSGTLEYVATLRRSVDCQWQETTMPFLEGQRLASGTLALDQGVAEIAFDTGATLTLEGPAELRIIARSAAQLLSGKLVFKGDATSIFDLSTPAVRLIDIGTEYAVSVAPDSEEIHVFEGEVLRSDQFGATDRLLAGEARRYSTNGQETDALISLATEDFVRQIPDASPSVDDTNDLLTYETFSYDDSLAISSDLANGGAGWSGSWEFGGRSEVEQPNVIPLINTIQGLASHGEESGLPGMLEFPSIERGLTRAGLHRSLATPLRLDQDGVYYFSLLFEFDSGTPLEAIPDAPYAFMFILRPDFPRELRQLKPRGQREELAVGVYSNSHAISILFQQTGIRTAVPMPTGQPYLLVGKIVCSRDLPGQVLVRVLDRDEPLTVREPYDWTLIGCESLASRELAIATIHFGAQQYEQRIDEVRIGRTWASVTAPLSQSR
ncbi:MAG: FecR domain-containing protein [Fuerstiella sp.]|nr:FecR domain-containing protein [Fuerstiella sp.]MCP4858463.1 FecR domain-containing protein [Fuerstiella sp.]